MRITHWAMYTALLFSGAIVFYLIYALLWPIKVIHPNMQPYQVVTKEVKLGGKVTYIVDACKYRDSVGTVSRKFVINEIQYTVAPGTGAVKKGCTKTNVTIDVPDTLPEGKAYLSLDVAYPINPFRNIYYSLKTEDFTIVK